MTDLGPIENETIHDDDAFSKFKKERTQEAMALKEKGVVSNSNEIKKQLIDLFTRQSTYNTSEPKFYESNYEIPSSISETGSNLNMDRLECICQNISDRMQTLEGDIAIVKTSLFKPPEINSVPPPPPPPLPPALPAVLPQVASDASSSNSSSAIPNLLRSKPPSSRKQKTKSKPKFMKVLSASVLNPIQREKMAKTTFEKR